MGNPPDLDFQIFHKANTIDNQRRERGEVGNREQLYSRKKSSRLSHNGKSGSDYQAGAFIFS